MKNSADPGGCYLPRPKASFVSITKRDLNTKKTTPDIEFILKASEPCKNTDIYCIYSENFRQ